MGKDMEGSGLVQVLKPSVIIPDVLDEIQTWHHTPPPPNTSEQRNCLSQLDVFDSCID
jgi:hypothetical protein